ncbi:MAG: hypothetical protein J0L77_07615 [Alphaproteobacteria bacterium]|nr:hypothetical protein [Alphaproteobacteria bacterium]
MFSNELMWWITVVDIPVLTGLFWLIWRTRKESEEAVDDLHEKLERRASQFREGLSAFKLEVAKNYASVTDMKDLETRIVSHLLRIESKLDQTALKTESLQFRP